MSEGLKRLKSPPQALIGEAKQRAIKRPKQNLLMVFDLIWTGLDRFELFSSQMSETTLKLGSSAQTQ